MDSSDEIRELRKSLLQMIEFCEELNLMIAEMVIRFGNPQTSDYRVQQICRSYERFIREAREKWNLPKHVC